MSKKEPINPYTEPLTDEEYLATFEDPGTTQNSCLGDFTVTREPEVNE